MDLGLHTKQNDSFSALGLKKFLEISSREVSFGSICGKDIYLKTRLVKSKAELAPMSLMSALDSNQRCIYLGGGGK